MKASCAFRCGGLLVVLWQLGCGAGALPGDSSPAPLAEQPRALPEPTVRTLELQAGRPLGAAGVITFHSDRTGRNGIFTLDLATGIVSPLTADPEHQYEDVAWSPDGERLAMATTRFDSAHYAVGVFDAAGGAGVRITTNPATERQPVWTVDGRGLLFVSDDGGTQAVYRVALGTTATARISPVPDRALMPTAAPDGRRVAYTMGSADGLRVVVHDLETGAHYPVSAPGADAAEPRWSPDGRRIAYAQVSSRGSSLAVLTLDSGVVQTLSVEGLASLREPAWSPDGCWIAASASAGLGAHAQWDLVLVHPESFEAFRLTGGSGNDRAPAWRPR